MKFFTSEEIDFMRNCNIDIILGRNPNESKFGQKEVTEEYFVNELEKDKSSSIFITSNGDIHFTARMLHKEYDAAYLRFENLVLKCLIVDSSHDSRLDLCIKAIRYDKHFNNKSKYKIIYHDITKEQDDSINYLMLKFGIERLSKYVY